MLADIRAYLIMSIVSLVCFEHSIAGDLVVEFKPGEASGLLVELRPEAGLDMGETRSGVKAEKSLTLKSSLKKDLELSSLRSPCPCLEIDGEPERLKPDGSIELKVVLSGEGYSGSFVKSLRLKAKLGRQEQEVLIPVKFRVSDDDGIQAQPSLSNAKSDEEGPLLFTAYKGGGVEAYSKARAFVFAAKGCASCNFLKAELLPKLLLKNASDEGKPEVVDVDLDAKSGFLLLSELEEKLGFKGDATPVLLYGGRLHYGNNAVKDLIEKRGVGN